MRSGVRITSKMVLNQAAPFLQALLARGLLTCVTRYRIFSFLLHALHKTSCVPGISGRTWGGRPRPREGWSPSAWSRRTRTPRSRWNPSRGERSPAPHRRLSEQIGDWPWAGTDDQMVKKKSTFQFEFGPNPGKNKFRNITESLQYTQTGSSSARLTHLTHHVSHKRESVLESQWNSNKLSRTPLESGKRTGCLIPTPGRKWRMFTFTVPSY